MLKESCLEGGVRFDPLLEEKGGWMSGEVPRQDEEMAYVVTGVMAEVNHQATQAKSFLSTKW